jgi:prevent-host-death family protein
VKSVRSVNIHEAKTHLSRFVDEAAAGEEIIIARAGKPVARLVALASPDEQVRTLGLGRGQFTLPHDFNALHREEIRRMFEEGD